MLPRYLALFALVFACSTWAEVQRVGGLDFRNVLVYGNVEVQISQGPETLLLLRGDSEELDLRPFFLSDDTLVLGRSREQPRERFGSIKFKLTVTELERLQVHGGGNVYVKPIAGGDLSIAVKGTGDVKMFSVTGDDVFVSISGSGDIQIAEIAADELTLMISGSGDLHVGELRVAELATYLKGSGDVRLKQYGSAQEVELKLMGSGDIDLSGLDTGSAEVNIIGSGDARIGVSSELDVHIMGSGDVYYRGSPRVEQSILGSGDVRPSPGRSGLE